MVQWKNIINTNIVLNINHEKIESFFCIMIVLILSFISGATLKMYTSKLCLDALTTWGAIITIYDSLKNIKWIYWFVIDSINSYLSL